MICVLLGGKLAWERREIGEPLPAWIKFPVRLHSSAYYYSAENVDPRETTFYEVVYRKAASGIYVKCELDACPRETAWLALTEELLREDGGDLDYRKLRVALLTKLWDEATGGE